MSPFFKKLIALLFFLGLSFSSYNPIFSWGFFAHKKINRLAVFTLPPEMIGFYKRNIEYITEQAVSPDKRRYATKGEAPRHYIDIDHYSDENPFEIMPREWDAAVEKFTEDTLQAYGIVPWHVDKMVWRLTMAFKEEDYERILYLSADLGHYIADAHVPLHSTENYNGQLTGQKGIHGFWESRLPELFSEEYDLFTGRAEYVEDPLDFAWEAVEGSFAAKDSVLAFEKDLSMEFPSDQKYSYEERGQSTVKVYSKEYSEKYHELLNGMVERRMKKSIHGVGSLWYTAWVNAGQPDLSKFYDEEMPEEFEDEEDDEEEEGEFPLTREHEN